MASVWVARQRGKHGFEKLVAIKTILPKFAADIRFQEMFLDEARIASRIEHLNVAQHPRPRRGARDPLPGDGVRRRRRALEAQRARARRRASGFPTGVVLRVLADTCAGLHEAHELNDATGKPLGDRPPRREPAQHPRQHQGDRQAHRLRHRQGALARGHRDQLGRAQGQDPVHGPRAGARSPGRSSRRRLGGGRRPLSPARGQAAVRGGQPARDAAPARALVGPRCRSRRRCTPAVGRIVRKALAHAPGHRYPTAAELRERDRRRDGRGEGADHRGGRRGLLVRRTWESSAERRRHAIDLALAAAAERHRAVDVLGPTSEWGSVVVPTPPVGRRPILPLPSERAVPDPEATTLRPGSLSRIRPRDASAPRRVRASTIPGAHSSATPGSAALDASPSAPLRSRSSKSVMAGVALVAATAAAGGSGLSWTMGRSTARPAAAPTRPALAERVLAGQAARAPAVPAAPAVDPAAPAVDPAPSSPSARALTAGLPVRAANASPTAAPGVLRGAPRARSLLPTATAPPPVVPPRPPPTVDDGF